MNESNSIKVQKEAACEKAIKMGEQRMLSLICIEEDTDFSIRNQLIKKEHGTLTIEPLLVINYLPI